MARPTKYDPQYAEQAYKLCLLGADDVALADFFGVVEKTINTWKKKEPGFLQAIKRGKTRADGEVASRLYERATGFEWDEMQPIKLKEVRYKDGKRVSEKERVELVEVHKVVPPDTTAGIFWLKNRQKEHWRDKQEHDLTSNGKTLGTGLSAKQAEQLIRARANRSNSE